MELKQPGSRRNDLENHLSSPDITGYRILVERCLDSVQTCQLESSELFDALDLVLSERLLNDAVDGAS